MKKLLLLLLGLVPMAANAAIPGPPSTPYTRGLLVTTNQAEAQTYLGITGGGGGGGGGTNSVNGTNVFPFNLQDTATLTWAKSGSNVTGTAIGGTSETNITLNTYVSNHFAINGKNNTLIVTQALTLNFIKTNMLATDANGLVTTTKFGAGISWDPATQTISSSSSGGSAWRPNTALTYSGTNVTIDGSGGTNFFLSVTNLTTFFTTPSNVPASKTTNTEFTVFFLMSTAGCAVAWTNASFKWPGGPSSAFQPDTNANAVSYVTFTMSPFTNGIFMGDYGVLGSQ